MDRSAVTGAAPQLERAGLDGDQAHFSLAPWRQLAGPSALAARTRLAVYWPFSRPGTLQEVRSGPRLFPFMVNGWSGGEGSSDRLSLIPRMNWPEMCRGINAAVLVRDGESTKNKRAAHSWRLLSGTASLAERLVFAAVGGGHGLGGLRSLVPTCETAAGPPLICLRTMKYLHSKDSEKGGGAPDNIGGTTATSLHVM